MLKYRLIPVTSLTNQLNSTVPNQPPPPMAMGVAPSAPTPVNHSAPFSAVPSTVATIAKDQSALKGAEQKKNFEEIVDIFPPRLRNKAQLILIHVRNRIDIAEDNHVLYSEGERRGSSIYDLVRFFITPSPPRVGDWTRPPDAFEFGKLLQEAGTPMAAYGAGKSDFVTRLQHSNSAATAITAIEKSANTSEMIDKKKRKNKRTVFFDQNQTAGKWQRLK